MSSNKQSPAPTMARTHADAAAMLRRPFAPGAIGFRAMMRVPLNGDPLGGAHVAAYIGAQSVVQRLNAVVPGRWRQEFQLLAASQGAKKRYMACRLIITLPVRPGGRDVEAVYEDVGEVEVGSRGRSEGALLGCAQARCGGRRDRRLPIHGDRAGDPANWARATPGAGRARLGQARRARHLGGDRGVASRWLRAADGNRRGAPRPRRDPRPRRAQAWGGAGRVRRGGLRALGGASDSGMAKSRTSRPTDRATGRRRHPSPRSRVILRRATEWWSSTSAAPGPMRRNGPPCDGVERG